MADSVEKVIAEMRDYLAWTKPAALVIHELADRLEALSGSGEAVKPCKLVLTSPERIYLQISEDEGHYDEEFPKSPHGDEVTWCQEPTLDCEVEYVRADLAAPQGAGSVPEGWKLVPVEPTEAMLDAAGPQCHANRPYPQDNHCGPRAMRTTEYRAMLAAAPEYKQ